MITFVSNVQVVGVLRVTMLDNITGYPVNKNAKPY